MIIDAHTHLFPEEVQKNRQSFCRKDEGFRLLYASRGACLASLDQLLRAMNQDGVDGSVICGFPWKDPGLCREGNDFLLHCFRNHPQRLIPFACLPLGSLRQAQKELDRCLSLGIRGIGELALYDRGWNSSDLRRLRTLGRALSGGEVPLLLHTSEPVGHSYPGKNPESLKSIYQLLLSLPGVKIILAHWGGGFLFYELMPKSPGPPEPFSTIRPLRLSFTIRRSIFWPGKSSDRIESFLGATIHSSPHPVIFGRSIGLTFPAGSEQRSKASMPNVFSCRSKAWFSMRRSGTMSPDRSYAMIGEIHG